MSKYMTTTLEFSNLSNSSEKLLKYLYSKVKRDSKGWVNGSYKFSDMLMFDRSEYDHKEWLGCNFLYISKYSKFLMELKSDSFPHEAIIWLLDTLTPKSPDLIISATQNGKETIKYTYDAMGLLDEVFD
ncbi:MAG: hypothetical protein VW683_00080 [Betaproteobacteria bacterium]|jgi:hypothetical protein